MSTLAAPMVFLVSAFTATVAQEYCPKCKADRPASAKYCSQCGTRLTDGPAKTHKEPVRRAAAKKEKIRKDRPAPSGPMTRYESPDGKVMLFHPAGWRVQQGPNLGPGSYAISVASPDRTAEVAFATLPLGQNVKDSVNMAVIFFTNLARASKSVEVTRMSSTKDRSRTRVEAALTAADGRKTIAHVHFFHTPRAGTVYCMSAAADTWQASLPQLTQIVANLAYSPEGVRNVQKKANEMAAGDQRASGTGRGAVSPIALLAQAEGRPGRQLPLVQVTAPDQSFTLQIPRGWQFQGAVLQYWTSPDWQRKTHGVSFVSKEMMSPRATSIRVPGVIWSDYVPPPRALALVMADGQFGRNLQIISETPAGQIVPEVAQYLRMLEGRGLRGDIRLMHVRFTSGPTGQTCRGLFSVSCFVSPLGIAWSCLVEGGWAPDAEFDDYLPLYWRIVKSHRYNERFVGQVIAQQAARQRQLNQSLQRALAESREAFQALQGSFRNNSRARDYAAWLHSQTTLGQGTWVSQAEGGSLHQTDSWGIQREGGDRVDLPAYNNTNFTGRSPWTGEQLEEVNTRPEWERYVQGGR
ncbi:MAG: zinc ribbon domain-containing protein [Phycisphaerae bacterium]|nr:zinc ribbon domain-containing protein [Phycisphaerae bacterium]